MIYTCIIMIYTHNNMKYCRMSLTLCNSLPAALRTVTLSPLTFARHLKAHLFG